MFVEDHAWINEAMYQQIFAISQALPGSASAKMLFCINAVHGGLFAGCLAFAFFTLPGAIGMYGLSVGISRVGDTLPNPVYALLSGLNAATVGIIAMAAVNLASRAITDKITRMLVFLGGGLGLLYTALWYYPVIMVAAGLTTMVWDLHWLQITGRYFGDLWTSVRKRSRSRRKPRVVEAENGTTEHTSWPTTSTSSYLTDKPLPTPPRNSEASTLTDPDQCYLQPRPAPVPLSKFAIMPATMPLPTAEPDIASTFPALISTKTGSILLVIFTLSFLAIILIRALLPHLPRLYSLFSSLYLAGTIIFGGGPVVIPLLREYIVSPGWVSPRDFLLGLAIIQSFPGPNFNFAVYLGALATKGTSTPSFIGGVLAFLGMFTPGMVVMLGLLGLWRKLSNKGWFQATIRGINAAAVGLVFTAVYKLWEIGLVGGEGGVDGLSTANAGSGGAPLGGDPWLVFITAAAFVGGKWFNINAPMAILLGGVAGVGRWAVFER
ncbi:MAG: hypothetical protein Q9181_007680 [Wetmoreana brouardii]